MQVQSYDSVESLFAEVASNNKQAADDFNKYLPGSRNIDLEIAYKPLLKFSMSKKKRDQYGIKVREIKVFGKCPGLNSQRDHDFVVELFFMDGTNCILAMAHTETCDVDYAGNKYDAAPATKALTSILLAASEGQLPGFSVWNSLVKFEMANSLPVAEQSKLYSILD